jgi:hypothetical protein
MPENDYPVPCPTGAAEGEGIRNAISAFPVKPDDDGANHAAVEVVISPYGHSVTSFPV